MLSYIYQVLTRPIQAQDWVRVDMYAKHVRSFFGTKKVHDDESLSAVQISRLNLPLFPSLEMLNISNSSTFQPFLLSDTIVSLEICIFRPALRLLTALPTLQTHCPRVTSLEIEHFNMPLREFSNTICASLRGWHSIQTLIMQEIDDAVLKQMSKLPNLCTATVCDWGHRVQDGELPPLPFEMLHSLEIDATPIALLRLLQSMAGQLLSVTFKLSDEEGGISAPQFCELVSTLALRLKNSAQSIRIDEDENYQLDHAVGYIGLSPLKPFTHLTTVHIGVCLNFNLSDDEFQSVIASWPLLQSLHLGSHYNQPPTMTIWSLRHLVCHCRHLTAVELTVDATTPIELPSSSLYANTVITMLDLMHSPITDHLPVAAFLSDIFPNVKQIIVRGNSQECWNQVGPAISVFSEVRKIAGSSMNTN